MSNGLEIHDAASTGDFDSLEEYLRSGKFDANMKDEEWNNRTALHWACAKGKSSSQAKGCTSTLFLTNKVEVEPLACDDEGYVECIRLLLDYGAIGTSRTDTGWTPAHFAAETGKLTALRALFNANVSVGAKDKYGDTPKRVAEIYGHTECVKFLERCAEDAVHGIKRGISPKFTSAFRGRRSRQSVAKSESSSPTASRPPSSLDSPRTVSLSAEDEQQERGIKAEDFETISDSQRET